MTKSIRARFTASLLANVIRGGLSLLTALLLARWLGPSEYGRLIYLLASFAAFRQFLDMGTSTAFFTFLSQKRRSLRFVSVFWCWVGLQLLVAILLVIWVLPDRTVSQVWPGESRSLLLLALLASFMQGSVWTIASQMAEASRETIRVQRLSTLIVIVHLLVALALWIFDRLAIPLVLAALAIEWALAGYVAASMYRTGNAEEEAPARGTSDRASDIWRDFLRYCYPLIPYAWVGFAHDFADRWMLQQWGGTKEQAYFGVAQQFSAVSFLATTSILSVFWKEIAAAYYEGNIERVKILYSKVSRMLFFAGAATAGGLLPWSEQILRLTVGEAYVSGATTLMLMLLYPVHQTMGQIGGTMLYATGQIRLQVTLGTAWMLISIVVAYFLMAPADAFVPGLGLASRGLAWKMVLLQVAAVNVLAWFIARRFRWTLDWFHQIASLCACAALGWIAHFLTAFFFSTGLFPAPLQLILAAAVYVVLIIALILACPWIAGFSRVELAENVRRLTGNGLRL